MTISVSIFETINKFPQLHFFQNAFNLLHIMQLEIIQTLYWLLANLNIIIECWPHFSRRQFCVLQDVSLFIMDSSTFN